MLEGQTCAYKIKQKVGTTSFYGSGFDYIMQITQKTC